MKEILKTTLLEYEKSSFLLDLIKYSGNKIYINVGQTIHNDNDTNDYQELKINPGILKDLLNVLESYLRQIPRNYYIEENIFSEENTSSLIKYYLKGMSIKDMAVIFNCSTDLIEQVLTNHELPIVENDFKTIRKTWRRRRKLSR